MEGKKIYIRKTCSDHKQSDSTHRGRLFYVYLEKGLEIKIEKVLEEGPFEFRKGKGTRNDIGLMRFMLEKVFDNKEETCLYFIHCSGIIQNFLILQFYIILTSYVKFASSLKNERT